MMHGSTCPVRRIRRSLAVDRDHIQLQTKRSWTEGAMGWIGWMEVRAS